MDTVKLGKNLVKAIILMLLLMSIITIIRMVVNGQADEMGANIFFGFVRFALLGSILYFLYAGNKVAKWLIVISILINGISNSLALLLAFNSAVFAIDILNLVIVVIHVIIGVVLIVSSPVNNFLRFQRGKYKEESTNYKSEN